MSNEKTFLEDSISKPDIKLSLNNPNTVEQYLMKMPALNFRHSYVNWYLKTYSPSSTFYIAYQGDTISTKLRTKTTLVNVLTALEAEDDRKSKGFFQL